MAGYDYEWLGYGLRITTPAGTCFIQGEEAGDLYDELEAIETEAVLEMVLSEYELVCEPEGGEE